MEHYINVVYDIERNKYPQSSFEATERALQIDKEMMDYYKAIMISYDKLKYIDINRENEKYEHMLSDIEGWIKEIAILYGKLKFLIDYTKQYSYEKLRRTSNLILNLEIYLHKNIEYLVNESHKNKASERKYYEICLGLGYDIKCAIDEANLIS